MKEIGLWPSNTGESGRKETGQSVTHYIVPDGAYARAYRKLAASGLQLNWQSGADNVVERKKKQATKTKSPAPPAGSTHGSLITQLICCDCDEQDKEEPMVMEAA
jgi:hypothetical protein